MSDVAVAFRDADGPMQADLLHCLDFMNGLPFFRAYKANTWDALEITGKKRILDVACGVGFDVIEMAKLFPQAEFVGVDRSESFLGVARSRAAHLPNASFFSGDAVRLSFPDDSFHAARIDRSLQHMTSPLAAIEEMIRVTRSGGRIVASEPDWGTFFLFNGDDEAGARMAGKWLESIANPHMGREIGQLFEKSGVEEIRWRARALVLTRLDDANVVFDLPRLKKNCVAAGVLSAQEADDWQAAAERASGKGTFLACLNIFECKGVVRK
ncbi:methyltransferase domain-containing protein [Methylocystis sp. ATCC 49242]|uniref:methyltransferase domain-containing protein n=1 Tax=Methylocystis sp. ATCC 49242 TaxID=622637 RepID=UPI0001F867F4|nr:methyltransferase domain-containing protein [Methylocystis sp. ATCC 49242]